MTLSPNRTIYAVCGGIIVYVLLEYSGQFLLARMRHASWGYFEMWYYLNNLLFAAAMLSAAAAAYRFRAEVFCWDGERTPGTTSWIKSIPVGLLGGTVALVVASPTFWFGWGHGRERSIQLLIASAFSPLAVLNLLFVIFALAVSSEVVFRGIFLRTLAGYASVPAAVLASSLFFSYIFPVLGFGAGIILGITCSILYYKTKNLLAPIFANALFTVGGSGIALYHRLM